VDEEAMRQEMREKLRATAAQRGTKQEALNAQRAAKKEAKEAAQAAREARRAARAEMNLRKTRNSN
jgi:hypothetical protein